MRRPRRSNYYTFAIWIATILASAFILPFILLHMVASGGPLPEWVLALVFGPFFVSQEVAGAGYIGKWIDFLTSEQKLSQFVRETISSWKNSLCKLPSRINAENVGLTIGIVIGVTVTILQVALHFTIPFASVVGNVIAGTVFCLTNISDFGGLGNRLGRTIDHFFGKKTSRNKNIFRNQNVNYALAIVAGVIIGAALVTAALIVSAASFGVVPSILLTVTAISACASSSGYIGRCADFFLGERTAVHAIKDGMSPPKIKPATTFRERCSKENIGTVIGVTAGIVAASVLIGLGIVTLPFFGVGLPKIFLGVFLMAAMVGAGGGLGNRLGQAIDKCTGRKSLGIDDEQENLVVENNKKDGPNEVPKPPPPSQKISFSLNDDEVTVASTRTSAEVVRLPLLGNAPRNDKAWKKALASDTTYEKHGMFKEVKRPVPRCVPVRIEDELRQVRCAAAA